jgi:hypothetical protein
MSAQMAGDTLVLDSLAIQEKTFQISEDSIQWNAQDFILIPLQGKVVFKRQPTLDKLKISYKTIPLKTHYSIYPDSWNVGHRIIPKNPRSVARTDSGVRSKESLQTSGNIFRGIQVGNNQNASVQSGMNLTLSGWINSEWQVQGQLSDAQIPMQPGGYSSKLEDFDQVNIVLFNKTTKLIAGDFSTQGKEGTFLRYFKRGQGLQYKTTHDQWSAGASLSLSKGRFCRQSFTATEGSQGPYRLQGASGEQYIILIAGTEAVYVDGKKMERGQEKDYVIDYNSALITFTAAQPMTKDKRIVVEFQYSDKQYFRPLVLAQAERKWEGGRLYWNYFNEWDAKNQPLQLNLTDSARFALAQAGDASQGAWVSGATPIDGGVVNGVAYAQRDSLGMSYWMYSTDTTQQLYRVVFSYVGAGQGDYRENGFSSAGKIYQWIAPLWDGQKFVHQGDYIDKSRLTAPKKLTMWVVGLEQEKTNLWGTWKSQTEVAVSDQDLNLFSSMDDGNNQGWAIKTQEKWERIHGSTSVVFEYNSMQFQRVERFREVEFERNWNILGWNTPGAFKNVQLVQDWKKEHHIFSIAAERLELGKVWEGSRIRWKGMPLQYDQLTYKLDGWYTQSKGVRMGTYARNKSRLDWTPGNTRLYYQDEMEWNAQSGTGAQNPYAFVDYMVGFGTKDTLQKKLVVFYRNRTDRLSDIANTGIATAARAEQMGLDMAWQINPRWRNYAVLSRRQLMVEDKERFTGQPERTWVGRLGTNWANEQQSLFLNVYYETGSGLEQRKSYIYMEVPAGQGNYVWVDYNKNGIKELNEFEVAAFGYEANYIRSALPTNDFIAIQKQKANASLQIKPKRGWLKPLSNVAHFQWENQGTQGMQWEGQAKALTDTTVIQYLRTFRNQTIWNVNHPIWSVGLDLSSMASKNALTLGYEWKEESGMQPYVRYNIFSNMSLQPAISISNKRVQSDFLNGRNYRLHIQRYQVEWLLRKGTQSQLTCTPSYVVKSGAGEVTPMQAVHIPVQVRWNQPGDYALTAELAFHDLRWNGDASGSMAYDVLEGLVVGRNATWMLQYQTQGGKLQWTLQYNGRQSPNRAVVHTGMLQVRLNL